MLCKKEAWGSFDCLFLFVQNGRFIADSMGMGDNIHSLTAYLYPCLCLNCIIFVLLTFGLSFLICFVCSFSFSFSPFSSSPSAPLLFVPVHFSSPSFSELLLSRSFPWPCLSSLLNLFSCLVSLFVFCFFFSLSFPFLSFFSFPFLLDVVPSLFFLCQCS